MTGPGSQEIMQSSNATTVPHRPASPVLTPRGAAVIATAAGAVAIGALAIGVLAIRRLVIRSVVIERAEIKSLAIADLAVARLRAGDVAVTRSLTLPREVPSRATP